LQHRLLAIALARAKRGQHAQRGLALARAQHRYAVKQRAASGLAKLIKQSSHVLICASERAASGYVKQHARSHVLICASGRATSGLAKQHARSHVLICVSGRAARSYARSSRRAAHRGELDLAKQRARVRASARASALSYAPGSCRRSESSAASCAPGSRRCRSCCPSVCGALLP
jgi:hypothetical protein